MNGRVVGRVRRRCTLPANARFSPMIDTLREVLAGPAAALFGA
jgi:hypothetical protein